MGGFRTSFVLSSWLFQLQKTFSCPLDKVLVPWWEILSHYWRLITVWTNENKEMSPRNDLSSCNNHCPRSGPSMKGTSIVPRKPALLANQKKCHLVLYLKYCMFLSISCVSFSPYLQLSTIANKVCSLLFPKDCGDWENDLYLHFLLLCVWNSPIMHHYR